jgi:lysyl-tRNA synthetase class I
MPWNPDKVVRFRLMMKAPTRAGERDAVMPMGPTCRVCGRLMYKKVSEKKEPMGNTVVYECTNNGCSNYVKSGYRLREKVFEPK